MISTAIDVEGFINERRFSVFQWLTLSLCFLVMFIDGFDVAIVGYLAPAISKAWNIPPADLKQLLTVGFLGVAVGAFISGPIADRFGRKWIMIIAVTLFGLSSLASAAAGSIDTLTVTRFVMGVGRGAATPNATTLIAEFSPVRRRSFLVTLTYTGLTLGSAAGGFVAAALIPHFGWQSVFLVGGIVPILLAIILAAALPESLQYLALRGSAAHTVIGRVLKRIDPAFSMGPETRFVTPKTRDVGHSSLIALFESGRGLGTAMLWVAFFMGLTVIHLLTSWLPTLLTEIGADIQKAALTGAMFQLGGSVGALAVSWWMDRFSPHLSVGISYLLGAAMLVLIGGAAGNIQLLEGAVFFTGFFIVGSQGSLFPLAAAFYPIRGRATGVGWMLGIGRFGSILGAFAGGILFSAGWNFQIILGVLAGPAMIAGAAVFVKRQRYRARPVAAAAAVSR